MTISNTNLPPTRYTANGATTAFPTLFQFLDDTDLVVTYVPDSGDNEVLVLNTNYTVSGGDGETGTVTTIGDDSPYDDGDIVIDRETPLTQEIDLTTTGSFDPDDIESGLDKTCLQSQERESAVDRAVRLKSTADTGIDPELPDPEASTFLAWNADGDGIINAAGVSSVAVSTYGATLVDDLNAAAARTTLGLGSAAVEDAGTGAGEMLQLDASARIPAVDGSLVTGLISKGWLERPKFEFVERLAFTSGGTYEVTVGDTVTGATGGATGYVAHVDVTSGTWAGGDAAGNIFVHTITGTFQAENLDVGANANVATIAGDTAKDSILIHPGAYRHVGTVTQTVYWDSNIAFIFGSGGSNSDSDDLANSKWFLLFLDDSAIQTAGVATITASELVAMNEDNVTVEESNHGYYEETETEDRCIGAFLTDGSANILEIFHEGNEVIHNADAIADLTDSDIDTTWTDVTLSIPPFCRGALVTIKLYCTNQTNTIAMWRTNGQKGTTGKYGPGNNTTDGGANTDFMYNTTPVITDTEQIIEIVNSAGGAAVTSVYTDGYILPKGM